VNGKLLSDREVTKNSSVESGLSDISDPANGNISAVPHFRSYPMPCRNDLCILVTGFGAFPGERNNPTSALVRTLEKARHRLARRGIRLALAVLPVVFSEIEKQLKTLAEKYRPAAILHFGLAGRHRCMAVETRAINRLSLLHHDASHRTAGQLQIRPGAALALRSTFAAVEIATSFRRAGYFCRLSNTAGKYICNETLYLSLSHNFARQIGFIHVPRIAMRPQPLRAALGSRLTLADLERAAIQAILISARKLRGQDFSTPRSFATGAGRATSLDPIDPLA
jgi:pyroglutamyl-peptidase